MSANTLITSVVTGGTNSHATVSSEANAIATDFVVAGVVGSFTINSGSGGTGSFCVNADASPDMGVTIKAGQAYVSATPSSQDAQVLRVRAAADYTAYTINANASGSTKYDWIYLSIDATKANNPAADASDVASFVTSRSSSNTADNGSPPTYGILLAVVTVANGASSITNSNITDKRSGASLHQASQGWILITDTWTYSSYDSTNKTGVITVPSDATASYNAGMRVKFTNNSSTQYGIITKVASTALTVYFGTDYSLTNSAITNIYYSDRKAPFGFPLDPTKWTVTASYSSDATQTATGGTWYNLGSLSISAPIGVWRPSFGGYWDCNRSTATSQSLFVALSSSNSSVSDAKLQIAFAAGGASGTIVAGGGATCNPNETIVATSATTYYLIEQAVATTAASGLRLLGATYYPSFIQLVCAYL